MSTDRSEYRDHIIEITLTEEARGRWQADWAVFEKEPFRAVAAGMIGRPGTGPTAARGTAWRGATRWVDAYLSEPDAGTVPALTETGR